MSILMDSSEELLLPNEKLIDLCKELDLGDGSLMKIRDIFQRDMLFALEEPIMDKSSISCDYTFIRDLPTGDETGKFIGLNLTNTTFRIAILHMTKKEFDVRTKNYAIPEHLRKGEADELMDYIVSHLYSFILKLRVLDESIPLALTFSIPYEQRSLTDGHLMEWNGELQCDGMRTRDVADLLQMAINRIDLNVNVVAIITDATGMLISCAWERGNARAAFKLGETIDCSYVERVDDIPKFKETRVYEVKIGVDKPYMIISIQCGTFGRIGRMVKMEFARTKWDKEIDKESKNPGERIFEKMVCKQYLGELTRKVLLSAVRDGIIFDGDSKQTLEDRLQRTGVFRFQFLLDVEGDPPGKYTLSWQTLSKLGCKAPTRQDCIDLRFVCYAVLQRSCRLVAATAAAILNHMGFSDVTIAFDGEMYRQIPGFSAYLAKKMRTLTSPFIYFRCLVPQDGVGVGAAMVAALLQCPDPEKLKRDGEKAMEAQRKEEAKSIDECAGIC